MSKLQKILDNFARPRSWFNFAEDDNKVYIYDFIGSNFWGEGLSAKGFISNLQEMEKKFDEIDIHINCKGGDINESLAIYNHINMSKVKYNGYVDSIAASCAAFLLQGCDKRYMPPASQQMIHNAWAFVAGNSKELRQAADQLDTADTIISGIYVNSTGMKEKEVRKMMDEETYMDGATAVDLGFADELLEEFKMAACAFELEEELFPKLPQSFRNMQKILNKRNQENSLRDAGLSRSQAKREIARRDAGADSVNVSKEANELIKMELQKCLRK